VSDAVQLTMVEDAACALHRGGTVSCWGSNQFGELGDGTLAGSESPVQVAGITDAVSLGESTGAQGNHFCAQRRAGSIVCWGRNNFGQLGDGTTEDRSTPVTVIGVP
jgi:alpha-tubulin suppressor-like RCC1 family protein